MKLCRRGHRIVVVAPSESAGADSRGPRRRAADRSDPEVCSVRKGCAQVLAVGQSIRFRRSGPGVAPGRRGPRTIEELLESANFDFVHVHEPFAPSASSAALRHFARTERRDVHAPTERVLSTQVARKLVELLFGRPSTGRTASFAATRDVVASLLPGDYEVIRPGADLVERPHSLAERETVEDRLLGRRRSAPP